MTKLSAEEIRENEKKVRDRLRVHLKPQEIKKELGWSQTTLYRYLNRIRRQDQKWVDELAKGDFIAAHRVAVESMEGQIQDLIRIKNKEGTKDFIQIQCCLAIVQIEKEILGVLAEGPTMEGMKKIVEEGRIPGQATP